MAQFVPPPPKINAHGWFAIDFQSGLIIADFNADKLMEPASLTKLMTAWVVFSELRAGNAKLADEVLISKKAWQMLGSRMFVEVNKRVSIENLLKGMIIQSGNDASVALAEHVAGSESAFADLMNHHAKKLGMTS
ncbi:MAG: serine hydrolase, partial [Gammaproteobacteria bacterium]|nr:serine hydrolase [Gammaproteobacteria bacterium]